MTECNQQTFGFQALGSRRVEADFSGGHLSSDGGALLQFTEEQQRRAQEMLGEITTELLKHFETIKIDLKAREKSK